MILRPREYVSPDERKSLRPALGDTVQIIGDPRKYIVTAAGMRWYNLKNVESGEPAMAKVADVMKWTAPKATPSKKEGLVGTFASIEEEFEA
jgi:hypothetical protein